MSVQLSPLAVQRFYDNNNNPLSGGQLFTYQAGTTTPVATFVDSTATTANPNPVILNARGEAPVWLLPTQSYKFVLCDSSGNTIWTCDQITAPAPVAVGNMTDESGSGGTPGFAANVDFTPGTTTSLTLSKTYGSAANIWVSFDGAEQGPDSYSLSGQTLTFTSAIPVGVNKVFVKGGSVLTIGSPASSTITDSMIAPGSKTYNRIYDLIDVMDFGTAGNGTTDDTTKMNSAINASPYNYYPNKTFNVAGAFTLPMNRQLIMMPGSTISPSGAGTATYNGPQIQFGYNPSGISNWTTTSGDNYEGLSVDFGGYGARTDLGIPIMTAVNGSINIPSNATIPAHAAGVSGYAKTFSTTTGAVPIFGWGESKAANALAWGINTVTLDNGFATTIWGYECDINISNSSTNVRGIDITGGSTNAGNITVAARVGPLGAFQSPPLKWSKGIFVDDGSATVGVEIGASNVTGGGASGSAPFDMYYMTSGAGRAIGMRQQLDVGGNVDICQMGNGPTLNLIAGGAPGVGTVVLSVAKTGSTPALSFFGNVTKAQVTGWGTPSNGGIFVNFPGSAATLAQVGQVVSQLISDLKAFGLYGA